MKVLVLNCGSSSLKYQMLDMTDEAMMARGLVERIGIAGTVIKHRRIHDNKTYESEISAKDHKEAIQMVLDLLVSEDYGVMKDLSGSVRKFTG